MVTPDFSLIRRAPICLNPSTPPSSAGGLVKAARLSFHSGEGAAPPAPDARLLYAVSVRAARWRPSSSIETSRILNFWILPVTVIGKASVSFQ